MPDDQKRVRDNKWNQRNFQKMGRNGEKMRKIRNVKGENDCQAEKEDQ